MTEEKMLKIDTIYRPHAHRPKIRFSGLCENCGNIFYTGSISVRLCSHECQKGIYSSRWKGGRNIADSRGYVMILKPDHPRCNTAGRILEHTVVMENHLGRYLLPNENVHHKNGIKGDNRIENLELWTTYQPSGQRVEDLLDFVVRNYPEELKSRLL